jgi:predicted cupin superfamily sugar epimerase
MRTVGARLSSLVNAQDVVALLGLAPHPEGGWFRETWRSEAGTAIYYLLEEHQRSHWHRINADEVWHFYAGDPLALSVSADGVGEERFVLGPDLGAGHRPQHVVAAGAWQAARPLGRWTLVGCTVSPAFDFAGFELAPPDWCPSGLGPATDCRNVERSERWPTRRTSRSRATGRTTTRRSTIP